MIVVTLFKAPGCVPCKAFEPIMAAAAAARPDWTFNEVMAGPATQAVFKEFGVRAAPTVIVFRDGAAVARFSGMVSAARLDEVLDGAAQ